MDNPGLIVIVAASALIGIALVSMIGLRGFTAWIDLKKAELDLARGSSPATGAGNRIELADLKERIRKLEAIAAGVDL